MPATAPTYDLILLLSKQAEEERRAKIVSEVQSQIAAAGGQVARQDDWGSRPMTYQIRHEGEAEYHLLQFSGPTSLLDSLSHNLRIDDDVLRFRIIKLVPGTPEAPESTPPLVGVPGMGRPDAGRYEGGRGESYGHEGGRGDDGERGGRGRAPVAEPDDGRAVSAPEGQGAASDSVSQEG